jgi:predicted phosphate transport protein (TIGR00153 family)
MFNLSPKNDKFFDMFLSFAETINKSTEMLKEFVNDPSNGEKKFQEIKDVEHDGDIKLHELFEELNKSFITPLDREDIYAIGKALDDVIDFVEQTASRFVMFNITKSRDEAVALANLTTECTKELIGLMTELKKMKSTKTLKDRIVEINRIENEADVAYRSNVRILFLEQPSAVELMVWKEVYENLENIFDACEDVANIIEGVVMKHA